MSERFEVGEVAIYHRPESNWHGLEVLIVSGIETRTCIDEVTGIRGTFAGHEVEFSDPVAEMAQERGYRWLAEPHELRKRRPPQDWVKLCRLTEFVDEIPA